jgi:hypothetical protein
MTREIRLVLASIGAVVLISSVMWAVQNLWP